MAIQFKEHTSLLSTNDKKKCNVTVNVIAQLLMWPEEEKSWALWTSCANLIMSFHQLL